MNIDNKFGECCKCPALMQDGRIYTSYAPRRDYNASLMKEFKVSNSNEYRHFLQNNGKSIINSLHHNFEDSFRCVDTATNKFNVSHDVHKIFNDMLQEELKKPTEL